MVKAPVNTTSYLMLDLSAITIITHPEMCHYNGYLDVG